MRNSIGMTNAAQRTRPDEIAARFAHAVRLDRSGRTEAARTAYLAVLRDDAAHAGALNELGRLLERTGYRSAAQTAFARAVALHPHDPVGHGNLAGMLLDEGDEPAARHHYEIALSLDPANPVVHQCLAVLALRDGDAEAAAHHGRIGFRAGATTWPYRGNGTPVRVLALHSALGGNIHTDRLLDDRVFAKSTLVAEFYDPRLPLPPHDFVLNAIGDGDRCRAALRAARTITLRTRAPVVNRPGAVRATSRFLLARRLTGLPDVVAPRVIVRTRAALTAPDAEAELATDGFRWPLIVRAPGFHTGRHCRLAHDATELAAAAADLPAGPLLVIEFIDVRRPDRGVRKYRMMIAGSRLLPLHLAISDRWMVHYFSADMAERPEHRAEEAAFLVDPAGVLGSAALTALETVAHRLGLDCGGIDFALDPAGRVVVFEANATMIVPPPPPGERWAYRHAAVDRIDAALRAVLIERAATGRRGRA